MSSLILIQFLRYFVIFGQFEIGNNRSSFLWSMCVGGLSNGARSHRVKTLTLLVLL